MRAGGAKKIAEYKQLHKDNIHIYITSNKRSTIKEATPVETVKKSWRKSMGIKLSRLCNLFNLPMTVIFIKHFLKGY